MKRIVIIPARGGSKRIPRKNIKEFYGKPIISYSLENSKKSEIFDTIHVSTEDAEIYELVSQLGFNPGFYRSAKKADDVTPVRDVLIETILKYEEIGEPFDVICLLSATACLIDTNDLKDACQKYEESNMEYPMLAVTKYPVPVEWAMKLDTEKKIIEPLNNDLFFASSHSFKDAYYDIGSFAFFTRENLINASNKIRFIPYVLPYIKSVDVDNVDDWETLEKLYALNGNIK